MIISLLKGTYREGMFDFDTMDVLFRMQGPTDAPPALHHAGFGFLKEKWLYCADEFLTNNA
jgi:hypothetical protein